MAPTKKDVNSKNPHPLARVTAGDKFFGSAEKSFGMISSMMFLPMLMLGGMSGFLSNKTSGKVSEKLDVVSRISGLPQQNMEEILPTLREIAPNAGKHLEPVGEYAKKALGNDLSGRLGKVSTLSAIQLGVSGFSVANTARSFGDKIRVLKHLHRDVTGRDISTLSLVMGHNLPPIVKQARGHSLGKRVGMAAVIDVLLTGFNVATMLYPDKQPKFMQGKFFSNPFFQIIGMGALYQIPTMLVGNGGADPLSTYKQAHQFTARAPLPEEGYVTLIRSLAPDNMSNEECAARAKQCFTESWTPKQVALGMSETFGTQGNRRPVLGPATARLNAEASRQNQLSAS